jgi:hypothetical protein
MVLITTLLGHETLFDQGILHRDTSSGNIYLGEAGCPEGWEGFVADLELAWVGERVTKDRPIPRPKEAGQRNERYYFQEYSVLSSSRAPGAEITVRLDFFALLILLIIIFRALLCSWPENFWTRCQLAVRTRSRRRESVLQKSNAVYIMTLSLLSLFYFMRS